MKTPRSLHLYKLCGSLNRSAIAPLFAVSLSCVALLPLGSTGATVSLVPVADSYIKDDAPDANLNADRATLFAGKTANRTHEVRRCFLRFDMSSQIPAGSVIESVTVTLVVTHVPPAPANCGFDLRRVLQPWNELQVTWNSRLTGTPWATAGAASATDTLPTASSTVQNLSPVGRYTFPSTPLLVADVQSWVNDPASNNGWMLAAEDEVTLKTARGMAARENAANTPQLQVTYSVPQLAVTVSPPAQQVLVGSTATFQATGSGVPPFSYQWLFNGTPLASATTDLLTLPDLQTNESGAYNVVLTTGAGSATSAPVLLTVTAPEPGQPIVAIISPTNAARFAAHSDILFAATATESNGVISRVDFLIGSNVVGSAASPPYEFLWSDVPAGDYILTARSLDDRGTNGISPSLVFSVAAPPSIEISSPVADARFILGTNVLITATVVGGTSPASVEFFAAMLDNASGSVQTNLLGIAANAPFTFNWLPTGPGDYFLSARLRDNLGQTALSSNVSVRVIVPELIPPTITITSGPGDFTKVTTAVADFAGTGSDNLGLDHVEFQVFSGPFLQTAGPVTQGVGTTNWTAAVPLAPGNNAVQFRGVDLGGNKSAILTRNITFTDRDQLTILVNGEGTVSPDLNGHTLDLGKIYHVTAKPARNNIFAGWADGANTNNPHLSFEMRTNLVLVANFISNPFPALAGTYGGLFFEPEPNRFRAENAGSFSVRLTKGGVFTGKLQMTAGRYNVHGRFDATGNANAAIVRHGLSPLALVMQLDVADNAALISGTVVQQLDAISLNTPLSAVRKTSTKKTGKSLPFMGAASFTLTAATGEIASFGSLSATVMTSGGVKLTGTINSRTFHSSSLISEGGNVPCYVTGQKGAGTLLGWLLLNSERTTSGEFFLVPQNSTEAIPVAATTATY
jgi:hypothetical protein